MIWPACERIAGISILFLIVCEILYLRENRFGKDEIVIERVLTKEELIFQRRRLIYERA